MGFARIVQLSHNIVFVNYYLKNAFVNDKQVNVIYTDSFDKVNHCSSNKSPDELWFGEFLVFWFSSYLNNRKQCVKVFSIKSKVLDVLSEAL